MCVGVTETERQNDVKMKSSKRLRAKQNVYSEITAIIHLLHKYSDGSHDVPAIVQGCSYVCGHVLFEKMKK